MASEITCSMTVRGTKSGHTIDSGPKAFRTDWAGSEGGIYVQSIGTAEEAITIPPDVATLGVCLLENLEAAGGTHVKISIRQGTGTTNFMDIYPGESWLFRFSSSTSAPYAISSGAAGRMRVTLFEA